MGCPDCGAKLANQPAAILFTTSRRIERYWCDHCHVFQKAAVIRNFDREDAGEHYVGPFTWLRDRSSVLERKAA